jgi:multiple sugar transport system substrate-binding protein
LAGCPKPQSNSKGGAARLPLEGIKLRLVVAGDPELADAAARLRGEWISQTGSEFQVDSMTEQDLADAGSLAADAVVCPSYQLGTLAQRKQIVPLPKKAASDESRNWSGIFELLRLREAAWGADIEGVPFGSPVFTCYYRADLLKKVGRKPPQTWSAYQEVAELLADRKNLGQSAPSAEASWSGTMEPLGPGWAGLMLLARAAPYAKHRSNYSTLFNIATMEPLVAGPPMVRALQELVAAAKLGPPEQLQADPAAVRAAFWQGHCGMAISWPSAASGYLGSAARTGKVGGLPIRTEKSEDILVGFVELPGSQQVFDVGNRTWSNRSEDEDVHVPLLAVAGRIGAVAGTSAQPEAALQLLLWLSGDEISPQVSAASPATTLFRQSQVKSPQPWVEPQMPAAAAAQYAVATQQTFLHQQWLFAPRIPGRAEYLNALDEAVQRAVRGEQSPLEALHEAATRWEKITERLGVPQQRAAYLRSLGLE